MVQLSTTGFQSRSAVAGATCEITLNRCGLEWVLNQLQCYGTTFSRPSHQFASSKKHKYEIASTIISLVGHWDRIGGVEDVLDSGTCHG